MRRAVLLQVVAFAVLISLAAFATGYVRSAEPQYDRSVSVPGLRDSVEIAFDSLGIPHVFAANEEDLLFAEGWLHAQDRLWQLELFRRVAEGRLAEIFGADVIDSDRFLRTLGVARAAAATEAELDPDARRLLNSYVAGVNMWIQTHEGALPPEFLALRIRPRPWTVASSLAIEKLMAWDLSPYYATQNLAGAVARLGPERARFLAPDYPDWATTILPDAPRPPDIPAAAATLLDAASATRASNAWVVGGSRTASGKPILANDMHLALRAPGVWYLAALHGGGFDVAGMTLPGVPFVVAGHSRAVAWGFTNAMVDDLDLFVERVDSTDPGRYLTPDGYRAFEAVQETLVVKGRDEPVVFTVRTTRHGPVISDVVDELTSAIAATKIGQGGTPDSLAGRQVLSLRWASYDPSHSFRAFPRMNRAANAAEFREALRDFDNPHQNVVFADTAGAFGYQMAGHVPARAGGREPPELPVPGWTGEWDWQGRLPFESHPATMNPARGYVVTANNPQTAGGVARLITRSWEPPFRAQRITQMIEQARGPLDAAAIHAMQLDVKDLHAERWVGRAIDAARASGHDDVAAMLRGWDLRADADSRAAPYYYVWYARLEAALARDLYGADGWMPRATVDAVLEARSVPWRDDGAAAYRSLAAAAMDAAVPVAAGKKWGDLHHVVIAHAMDSARLLERVLHLDVGPAPRGGSQTTVNVSQFLATEFPVTSGYGPSERHVVDMADVDGAGGFILPAGESGIPFAAHYRDQFRTWLNGGLWPIPLDSARAARRAVAWTRLVPDAGR